MTITDRYRHDRSEAASQEERFRVWRSYAIATLAMAEERSLSLSTTNWRRAAVDADLPIYHAPFWRSLKSEELLDLWLALERVRTIDTQAS